MDDEAQDDGADLDDELAGAVSAPPRLPRTLLLPALTLLAAAAAPLHPDGFSFAQLVYAALLRSPLEAVIVVIGFGSPFLFGAILAVAALLGDGDGEAGTRQRDRLRRVLVVNLGLMHAQLVLTAFLLVSGGAGLLPLALLGFALVSGGYFVLEHARLSAQWTVGSTHEAGPSLPWLARWGATVIVATCGWIRLQTLIGVHLGWAVELVLASCMAIAVITTRRRQP